MESTRIFDIHATNENKDVCEMMVKIIEMLRTHSRNTYYFISVLDNTFNVPNVSENVLKFFQLCLRIFVNEIKKNVDYFS